MRFQLTLQVTNKQFRVLPLNYQYELSKKNKYENTFKC
jgi:hypothetical protein